MTLFVKLTRWADYLNVHLAAAEIDERDDEAKLKLEVQKRLIVEGPNYKTQTEARAAIAADDDVVDLQNRFDEKHAYRKMLEAVSENTQRDASLVSRELTRRTEHEPTRRRADRMSP